MPRILSCVLLASLLLPAVLSTAAHAQSSQLRHEQNRPCAAVADGIAKVVAFETRSYRGEAATVEGLMMAPGEKAKHPAIVLLHTSRGMDPPECFRWMQETFRAWGYASLLIDHSSAGAFGGSRGFEHSAYDRLADIEGAIAFLQAHPNIAPERIALIGWSQGARSILLALNDKPASRPSGSHPFKAAIAFYPTCPTAQGEFTVPLLLFHGRDDTDAPIESCRAMMANLSAQENATLIEYENAAHFFDHPHHNAYAAKWADDALERIRIFLDNQLGEDK